MANPGTTTYPATLDAFDNPGTATLEDSAGYGHFALHSQKHDAIEALETTVGTTAGTNVLMNFAAGQFPVRNTGGGATGTLVQTIVGGTLANTVLIGTPDITGGTADNITLGTATILTPAITGSVTGTTVFANFPEVAGTPDANNEVANKLYVDDTATKGTIGRQAFTTPYSGTFQTSTPIGSGTLSIILSNKSAVLLTARADVDHTTANGLGYFSITWNGTGTTTGGEALTSQPVAGGYQTVMAQHFVNAQAAGTWTAVANYRTNTGTVTYYGGDLIALVIPE